MIGMFEEFQYLSKFSALANPTFPLSLGENIATNDDDLFKGVIPGHFLCPSNGSNHRGNPVQSGFSGQHLGNGMWRNGILHRGHDGYLAALYL